MDLYELSMQRILLRSAESTKPSQLLAKYVMNILLWKGAAMTNLSR